VEGDDAKREETQEVPRDRLDPLPGTHQPLQRYASLYAECYIISTVQALFATEELPLMVDRLRGTAKKGKLTVFDEIRRIFDSLAKREEKGTIASLKARGP
jgi:hypothetical protein